MTRLRALLLIAAMMAMSIPATARAGGSLSVWTQSTAYKVQPTTAPGPGTSATMEGAQGAYEAYQLIVHAGSTALSGVNVSAGALSDGNGHTIPASSISFYLEWMIDFSTQPSGMINGSQPAPAQSPTGDGRVPDPLVPLVDPYTGNPAAAPFSVQAGRNQPIWMDVAIPRSAVGGTYTGSVTVSATGESSVAVPVTLVVWSFALPDMNTTTTHFKMSTGYLGDYHAGMDTCSGGSCWPNYGTTDRTITKRYEELAHTHRIDTGQNFVPDMSTSGTCNVPTAADWSAYDAAVAPYMDGTYWSDGVPSARLTVPFTPGASWGPEVNCTAAQYTALAAAWATHLKAKGWFNKAIVYAADEPDTSQYPAIKANAQEMINGDAGWKAHIMDTTAASDVATKAGLDSVLGIYTVAIPEYDMWYDQPASAYSRQFYGRAGSPFTAYHWPTLFNQGIRLWLYTSNGDEPPYPAFATNTLLGMEPLMLMWGSWYEGATGFLYWDMTDWDPANPWGFNEVYGKSGDGMLIYPGNHNGDLANSAPPANGSPASVHIDGPIPSYRLQMIREGLQDWALFNLATQKGLGSYAQSQVAQAYGQLGACTWSGCTLANGSFMWKTSDTLMAQIRHNVAQAIINGAPSGSATPTPTNTVSTSTRTATPSSTPTASPTRTPTTAPNASATTTPSMTPTATPHVAASATATVTRTPTPHATASQTSTFTRTATPSWTRTPVRTPTPTPTVTPFRRRK
jgi:hypothetical protein